MIQVFHPVNLQVETVDINEYCALFGQDREERASNMLTDVHNGNKVCQQIHNGSWRVQTQTNPTNQQLMYIVSPLFGRIASCTCDDFNHNSALDDDFECKHMILVDLMTN